MNLVPDIPPKLWTLSAVVVGYLLIDDLTANEQNALGNWLMLVAQVLCTNAFYKQVQAERDQKNNNQTPSAEETIFMMQQMVYAMNQEIEELKKHLN